MVNERLEQSGSKPSFEDVMSRTRQDFINTKTYEPTLLEHSLHGRLRIGNTFHAAAWNAVDALIQEGVDISELFGRMMRETTTSPANIDWGRLEGVETWDQVAHHLVIEIISAEIPKRYPELIKEDERRSHVYKVMPRSRKASQ